MDPMGTLRGRLGAARVVLEPLQTSPGFATASRIQMNALVEAFKRFDDQLDDSARTTLVGFITAVPFTSDDMVKVLEACAGSFEGRIRRKAQEFKTFIFFLTELQWDKLVDPGVSVAEKVHIIFSVLSELGLRLPSETTSKYVSSFLLFISTPEDQLDRLSPVSKKEFMTSIKAKFKAFVRGISPPSVWLATLPISPTEFARLHPALYSTLFSAARVPTPPRVDEIRLGMFDNCTKCRSLVAPATLPSPTPTLQLGGGVGQGMEVFAQMFMKSMSDMQASQARMCEMMLGRSPSSGSLSSTSSIGASPAPSPGGLRGLREMLDNGSELHLGGARAALPALPPPPLRVEAPAGVELHGVVAQAAAPATPKAAVVRVASVVAEAPAPVTPKAAVVRVDPPKELAAPPVPISGKLDDDDEDNAPLLALVLPLPPPPSAAEIALERAAKLLDRIDSRTEKRKRDVAEKKSMEAKVEAEAKAAKPAAGAAGAAGVHRGRGRPRSVPLAAPPGPKRRYTSKKPRRA